MARSLSLTRAPFYFLRHGETEINRLGLVAGQHDVELNETGWRQARAAGAGLRGRGIDAIYSSPLQRARDTAGCVAAALGLEVHIVPELAERNWGEFEGKPRGLRVRGATPAGGEGPRVFYRRTLAGLATIQRGTVPLVVAHSGTFRVLCAELGIRLPETAVENSQPLYLIPPSAAGAAWTMELISVPEVGSRRAARD